jgi:hypothetical protein
MSDRRFLFAVVALVCFPLVAGACDPVQDSAIGALGGEAPGVRRGPLHRPGQPCLLCHDGALGDPPAFSVAGTIFDLPSSTQGVDGATVSLTDANGSSFDAVTNAAGNFYVTPAQWTPTFPLTVAVTSSGLRLTMKTDIGRDGSCAGCHIDPAGPSSPGHVCLTLDDGATPP